MEDAATKWRPLSDSFPPAYTIHHLFRKYPNPYARHVHTVDTVSRSVDPETGIIRSERLIGVQQGAPRWITKVCRPFEGRRCGGIDAQLFSLPPTAFVREVIFVDPSIPSATMISVNLSLAQYVCVAPPSSLFTSQS